VHALPLSKFESPPPPLVRSGTCAASPISGRLLDASRISATGYARGCIARGASGAFGTPVTAVQTTPARQVSPKCPRSDFGGAFRRLHSGGVATVYARSSRRTAPRCPTAALHPPPADRRRGCRVRESG